MNTYRYIWTRRAVEGWMRGNYDPRHTISNIDSLLIAEGFGEKTRAPWIIVNERGEIARAGNGALSREGK